MVVRHHFRYLSAVMVASVVLTAGCGRGKPVTEVRPVAAVAPSGEETAAAEPIATSDDDFPWWRGTKGNGLASGAVPTKWSATENVVWSVPVPGKGHASPIVWGNQVFIATADDAKQTMSLISFDRATGKEGWTRILHEGGFMHTHGKNTQASPTPACDGKHVYWTAMVKDAIWVSAVTLDGQIAWQTEAGPFVSMHGYGSSPILFGKLVIVQGDSNGPGWLGALDKESGKIVWRVQRGNGASFATPVIAEVAGKTQLLLAGQEKVVSYDPLTGKKHWEAEGPATVCANQLAWNDELIFVSGGYPQRATWAMKADGSGEVVWKKNWKCYVPSMVVAEGRLIVPQDDGIVHCVEAASGKELWFKRLGEMSASPVLVDGKLLVTTESGKTHVLAFGDTFEQLAENENGDRCYATPTVCGGRIYLRNFSQLLCLGPAEKL
ncbi:MAG: PQQ-binding-like beta-propeller repeat protein [Pirellulaceae bacterium]|nr:PQQ-binding-like beta-propeller repeat protein [Pirellulaceae bacterium]